MALVTSCSIINRYDAVNRRVAHGGSGGQAGNATSDQIGGTGGGTGGLAGGEAGVQQGGSASLAITTTTLPDAGYRQPYRVSLNGSGGAGPYSWSVTSGALPDGIVLDAGGVLVGAATTEGVFPFEATVTDKTGAAVHAEFALRVWRKRWLAYLSDDPIAGDSMLYLVDVTNSAYPRRSIIKPTGMHLDRFQFSPDGHWFGYELFDAQLNYSAYVVDVSSPEPGPSIPIGEPPGAKALNWTPSSRAASFTQVLDASERTEVRYVDLTGALPPVAVPMPGATPQYGTWISDDVYVFESGGSFSFIRRSGSAFASPYLLTVMGTPAAHTQTQVAVVKPRAECADPSYVVDVTGPSVTTLPGMAYPSFDFAWITVPSSAHSGSTDVYRLQDYPTLPPTTTIAANPCTSKPAWAHFTEAFLWVDSPTGAAHLTTLASNSATTQLIGGVYGTPVADSSLQFSPDDQWVVFAADRTYLSHRNADAAPVSVESRSCSFSPTSLTLACWTQFAGDTSNDLLLFDLRAETPSAPTTVVAGYLTIIGWSADGTRFAYVGTDPYAQLSALYVMDVTNPTDTGSRVSAYLMCDVSDRCQSVRDAQFQP